MPDPTLPRPCPRPRPPTHQHHRQEGKRAKDENHPYCVQALAAFDSLRSLRLHHVWTQEDTWSALSALRHLTAVTLTGGIFHQPTQVCCLRYEAMLLVRHDFMSGAGG